MKLEKFVVTGSIIPTAEGETFSPVTVFAQAEIERMGASTIIEAVRELPGFSGNVATEQRTNGGTGASGVNLRGLAGTLTLLDGKRTAGFDNYMVLPMIALGRVEVVKDGAGSIYGSDALAGVFNNILISQYDGIKTDLYYGNTTENDAGVQRAGVLAGHTVGKTHVVVAAEYFKRNALHSSDREPSDQADQRFRGGQNGGSPTFSGRATARVGSATAPVQDLVLAPGKTIGLSSADFISFNPSTQTSDQMLNFRQYTPSIPAQERHTLYGRVSHSFLNDKVEAYVRMLYSHDRFYNGLAPSPMPGSGTAGNALRDAAKQSPHIPVGFFIPLGDNAASPGNVANGVVPFRTIALGPRQQVATRDVYDFATGVNGRIGQDWVWNLEYTYGLFERNILQQGAPGRARLVSHIIAGRYNPWALDTVSGNGPTGLAFDNPAALADSAAKGNTELIGENRGAVFNMSGKALSLRSGDVELGFGADYYRVDSSSIPEPIFFTGDLLGLNSSNPSISRGYGGGAFFGAHIPLVGPEMNIPFLRSAKLQLEGRYDSQTVEGYSGGASGTPINKTFTAHNPKVGLQLQPTEELLIRATWGTGFRLPTLSQLFAAPGASFPSLKDPLGFPIANQTQITTQGNPDLSPEESKTYSFGFVWSPKAVNGLSVTADYYYGAITGLVGEGSQFILNVNAAGQTGFVAGNPATISPTAPFASRITRAATGSVSTINSSNFNMSERETTGIDFAINYVWPMREYGRFMSRIEWNRALSWDLTAVPGSPSQSYLGIYVDVSTNAISPGSIPENKGYFMQSWSKGPWYANLTVNYIGELADNPLFTQGNVARTIEGFVSLDGTFEYTFGGAETGWRNWLKGVTVRAGGSNLLDEKAPFAAGAFNDSYDVTTHTNRGRFLYAQVTKKL